MLLSLSMDNTIALIMVDMGGVLAVHSDISMENKLLHDFGLTGFSSFAELDPSLADVLQEHSKNWITEDLMWQRFTEITGVEVPHYEGSLWGKYFRPELDPVMLNLLSELKQQGHRLVCATNTEPAHYVQHVANQDYALFDKVYASCEMGKAKPESEFFTYILAKENVQPQEVLFIDDNSQNCEAAAALNICAYHYEDAADLRWALYAMGLLK